MIVVFDIGCRDRGGWCLARWLGRQSFFVQDLFDSFPTSLLLFFSHVFKCPLLLVADDIKVIDSDSYGRRLQVLSTSSSLAESCDTACEVSGADPSRSCPCLPFGPARRCEHSPQHRVVLVNTSLTLKFPLPVILRQWLREETAVYSPFAQQ